MPTNRRSDSSFREVPMRRRPAVTILMLILALILTLPRRAQQTPFAEEQVSNMVRAGLGDDSGGLAQTVAFQRLRSGLFSGKALARAYSPAA
jgi:hypothetical protein